MSIELQRRVGANIRRIRRSKKWTQQVLAERAGLARSQVVRMENGDKNATIQTLARIAEALEIRLGSPFRDI